MYILFYLLTVTVFENNGLIKNNITDTIVDLNNI